MTVRVKGLDKAIKDLRKKGKEADEIILSFLENTAKNIEFDSIQNAARIQTNYENLVPGSALNITGKIRSEPENRGFTWKVFVNADPKKEPYFGWIEFGQGQDYLRRVASDSRYTRDIQDIAYEFIGQVAPGTGRLIGSPYFFPAYFKNVANMVEELKKEISSKLG